MRRIVDYRVALGENIGALEDKVKEMIRRGWQPIGGPDFAPQRYCQAMILYEAPDNSLKKIPG